MFLENGIRIMRVDTGFKLSLYWADRSGVIELKWDTRNLAYVQI